MTASGTAATHGPFGRLDEQSSYLRLIRRSVFAGSRTFVHEDIYDEFVEKATKLAANKKLGNPLQEGCEQGPQARRAVDCCARNMLVVADCVVNTGC